MKKLSPDEYAARYGDLSLGLDVSLYETEAADCRLPKRSRAGHKYSFGRALVLAGSRGFTGAPVLAANACERSGAGLTQLMVPESVYPAAAVRCDGAVVTPLPETGEGCASAAALPRILERLLSGHGSHRDPDPARRPYWSGHSSGHQSPGVQLPYSTSSLQHHVHWTVYCRVAVS